MLKVVIQNVGFQACTNLTYAQHFQAFLHTYSMNCFKTFTQFYDSDLTVMFFLLINKESYDFDFNLNLMHTKQRSLFSRQ